MLTVGLVIGKPAAGVRYQARVARYREQRTRHLYEMSKALAVGRSPQDIAATSEQFIASTFHARSQVLLPMSNGKLQPLTHPQGMTPWDDAIAQWSFDKGLPAGAGTDTLPASHAVFAAKKRRENLRTGGGGTGESASVDDPGAAAPARRLRC
ncbi:hypothetical protein ACLB1S_09475 [Escherichia coli]